MTSELQSLVVLVGICCPFNLYIVVGIQVGYFMVYFKSQYYQSFLLDYLDSHHMDDFKLTVDTHNPFQFVST